MIKKILFIVVLIAHFQSFSFTQAYVLDGAREFNGHYYKVFLKSLNWSDAKYYCQSMGGHLAVFENRDEYNFAKSLIKVLGAPTSSSTIKSFWIGGESDSLGFYRWITTKKIIDYFDWSKNSYNGQSSVARAPNKENKMRCVFFNSGSIKWSVSRDQEKCTGFICEWESKDLAKESNW